MDPQVATIVAGPPRSNSYSHVTVTFMVIYPRSTIIAVRTHFHIRHHCRGGGLGKCKKKFKRVNERVTQKRKMFTKYCT